MDACTNWEQSFSIETSYINRFKSNQKREVNSIVLCITYIKDGNM